MERFFFVTTYDNLSGSMLASLLNIHPKMACEVSFPDPFLMSPNAAATLPRDIDDYVEKTTRVDEKCHGNAQRFSAFELQYNILTQKSKSRLIKANIAVHPILRIQLLIKSWLEKYVSAENAAGSIQACLHSGLDKKHPLISLLNFDYFYSYVLHNATNLGVAVNLPANKLYLFALARVLAHDSADLPTPGKTFQFENLIENRASFDEFIRYLSAEKAQLAESDSPSFESAQKSLQMVIATATKEPLLAWQSQLLDYCLTAKLNTIYHPHIDKPLCEFYSPFGYRLADQKQNQEKRYTKLLSIHLNSNRPSQLVCYFDNIEETCDHPEDIEVVVNIDDNDMAMEKTLKEEITSRRFTLKYTKSPKPASFCDLWKPINKLLELTDPKAYFLLNISDEMLFATQGWDTILKGYVGYFADDLFRLRASRNKFRNYFDRWECSFAQDSIPITTKRWIDVGGDWNPCFGPDSYQQLIAFYLAKEGAFSNSQFLRDLPLLDIKFHGDVPAIGIEPHKQWKHSRDHIFAMQICQSYPMQLEAKRRAILIKATIFAHANHLTNYVLHDDKFKKKIELINQDTNRCEQSFSYHLSSMRIKFVNNIRKLRFFSHFGDGLPPRYSLFFSFMQYLKAKYLWALFLFRVREKMLRLISKVKRALNPKNWHKYSMKLIKSNVRSLYKHTCKRLKSHQRNEQLALLQNSYEQLRKENEYLFHLLIQANVAFKPLNADTADMQQPIK